MSEILASKKGGVLTLTFNRPAKMNAITAAMYHELVAQMQAAALDESVKVLLFTATGEHFTAGNDIYDFLNNPPDGTDADGFRFIWELHNFPKPLMAVVQGAAVGIGTTMLLHCDVVLATPTAAFSMPFVSLGLVPEAGSSYLFPHLVGYQRAARIFLTGETFSAAQALEMGIISIVAEDAQIQAEAIAAHISQQPPQAVRNTKALLRSSSHEAVAHVIAAEGQLFSAALKSDEARNALTKFATRRGVL